MSLCASVLPPPQTSVRNANSGANETTLLRARLTYITSSLFNDNIPSSSLLEHNVDQPHLLLTKTSNGKGESSFWCCCHPPAHHLLELNVVECETVKEWSGSQERGGVEISKKVESKSWVEVGAVSNCLLDLFHRRALPPPPGAKNGDSFARSLFLFCQICSIYMECAWPKKPHPKGMKYISCQILVSLATWGLLAASKN